MANYYETVPIRKFRAPEFASRAVAFAAEAAPPLERPVILQSVFPEAAPSEVAKVQLPLAVLYYLTAQMLPALKQAVPPRRPKLVANFAPGTQPEEYIPHQLDLPSGYNCELELRRQPKVSAIGMIAHRQVFRFDSTGLQLLQDQSTQIILPDEKNGVTYIFERASRTQEIALSGEVEGQRRPTRTVESVGFYQQRTDTANQTTETLYRATGVSGAFQGSTFVLDGGLVEVGHMTTENKAAWEPETVDNIASGQMHMANYIGGLTVNLKHL